MLVRQEEPGDAAAIEELTVRAFASSSHSGGNESAIIADLRERGELSISLVALKGETVVGHAAFSPVRVAGEDLRWFGLGPVSVVPGCQRLGTGSTLIVQGLEQLRREGARGCVVLGDPAYYGRFGFRADSRLTYKEAGPYFQCLLFKGELPEGEVTYAEPFA